MSRCAICDYSDETPSIFQNSSTDDDAPRAFHTVRGEIICDYCFEVVNVSLNEMGVNDEEKPQAYPGVIP